jgi:hypothetical protein
MPKDQSSQAKSFTVRLTDAQRQKLETLAAGQPLAEYIRAKSLDEAPSIVQRRCLYPIKDQQAAHQLLGELGRSRISENLSSLAESARLGLLELTPESYAVLLAACADIAAMRRLLMKALGSRSGTDDH